MASDNSFDVVSKIDRQEADNALNQAGKELSQRFDFKNTSTVIKWSGELDVEIESSTEERVKAALEVFQEKLVKRSISLKAFKAGEAKASGKTYKIVGTFNSGISQDQAKKITKLVKEEAPKSVKTQIMGDEVRVSSKSRDDLQTTIDLIKNADLDFATQFVNYR